MTQRTNWSCWTVAILLLFCLYCPFGVVECICPRFCRCSLDDSGYKQVVCDMGGLDGHIPVQLMENDIWKLVITAPSHNLNTLAISRNFYKFTQLRELHITNSLIPAIGDGSFKGMSHLMVLNLTHNNITQILESNFQDIGSLQYLHLDFNNIRFTPSAAFHNVPNLTQLTLSNNKISQLVPRFFLKLTKLEELNLNNNPLSQNVDPDVFKDIRQLRILRLSNCQQTQFNSMVFRYLPNLEILDLSGNRLPYFSIDDASYATKLKVLYLHSNRIQSISNGTFGGLELRLLTLANNYIQFLQKPAFSRVTIRDLDISNNNLPITDPELLFHLSDKLQVLSVGGNRISQSTLGKLVANLPRLHSLTISNLNMKTLNPEVLRLPTILKKLNVSHNSLISIPSFTLIALCHHLETLDLSSNQFRGLELDTVERLDKMQKLKYLYLHDNPWSCDQCNIPVMMTWLNSSRYFGKSCQMSDMSSMSSESCLRCSSPQELAGKAIQLLDDRQLGGCEGSELGQNAGALHQGHIGLVVACIILVLLLVTVVVVLIMYYRRGADYYTHEEEREDINGIYENHGADDETGDLLSEKKTKVLPTTQNMTGGPGNNGLQYPKVCYPASQTHRDNGSVEHY
ncbi:hypothetical protein CHUAL_002275 [Chamberlinius hualienensis]